LIIAPFQGLFDGGFITRGCAPLYPGLSHFAPSGLRNHRPSFSVYAWNPWILNVKNTIEKKVGLRALIRGLGVGGRKRKQKQKKAKAKESKRESRLH